MQRKESYLLSVVVPMYYEELVARECHSRLTSALSGLNYELVYVNDGSKDRTLDILREIAQEDPAPGSSASRAISGTRRR